MSLKDWPRESRCVEPIHISEHAVVRYIERVMGLEWIVDEARKRIARDTLCAMGTNALAVSKGKFRYVLRDNCVVTIKTRSMRHRWE